MLEGGVEIAVGESQFSYKTKSGDNEKATKLLDMPFFILNYYSMATETATPKTGTHLLIKYMVPKGGHTT